MSTIPMHSAIDFEQELDNRLRHRKKLQIRNFADLSAVAQWGGADAMREFPGLKHALVDPDPKDSLRNSIFMLWLECVECFIFGEFQHTIIGGGAIVERCLRLEYLQHVGPITTDQAEHWTLGKWIRATDGKVPNRVTELAKTLLPARNDRSHAKLEHSDPQLAVLGGDRGTYDLGTHYYIEPYRNDALRVVKITSEILKTLYGAVADKH